MQKETVWVSRIILENLRSAVALHFAHYNFVRAHRTLKVTPAMEAGITYRLWSIRELAEMAKP
ncbi:MAG: hypothetical protein WCG29_14245, partial [Desulfomonile sp.]